MNRIRAFWRNFFDIRAGEHHRLGWMWLYITLLLFAYYIIKPVSQAMFLAKLDVDDFPLLLVVVAIFGGLGAYIFTKAALHSSLKAAVTGSVVVAVTCLVLIWWALPPPPEAGKPDPGRDWMLYVFNIFVSIFSISLVSQAWLVAANVFTTREAKRLYGILGVGAVIGAAFGGTFTAQLIHYIGQTRNLLLACAVTVVLAWLAFLRVTRLPNVDISRARGSEEEEQFSAGELFRSLGKYRHLQVIITIIIFTYIVDTMVNYQFSAMARREFDDVKELTAFLANFYGIWLNLLNFTLQFFLTAYVVGRFGVGGTLQIMPVTIAVASIVTATAPAIWSTAAARMSEAASRYTFNKTGMELLYLPLPQELKNRTKAFLDVFVDRFARGIGGAILLLLTRQFNMDVPQIALVVLGFCGVWSVLSIRARNEYVATVRKRLELRRLDLDALRVNVREAGTIRLLEETARGGTPRQAAYALSLLTEAPGYPLERILDELAGHPAPEVRARVYGIARERQYPKLADQALAEIRSARAAEVSASLEPAVDYALAVSPDTPELARRLLDHPNQVVAESAVEALVRYPAAAEAIFTPEWIAQRAASPDARNRLLAATAIRIRGDQESAVLQKLILDPDGAVATAACRTAGALKSRTYVEALLQRVAGPKVRGAAVEALAAYGERIIGTLGDVLLDATMPVAVRRLIPRVLQRIAHQRSVDVLLEALNEPDLSVRSAALRGLNSLREAQPNLSYGRDPVFRLILSEARYYYELNAALGPFRERSNGTASGLLARTIQDRLNSTLERLFRLLGLRYPPREIYAAYIALYRRDSKEQATAALEFLDNVLEREVKRIVLPLLDDEVRVTQSGRELYGIENKDVETALRDLIRSGDAWLTACAIATAAELRARQLAPEIAPLTERSGSEVSQVAQSALAVLA
jgi:AAA family ATP:ADP antiporter